MLEPVIVNIAPRKIIGMHINTSISENRTAELWKQFMPRLKEITNILNNNLYSVQIFGELIKFEEFTPQTMFQKWAAVEVYDFTNIPPAMNTHILTGGKYAIFIYKGSANDFYKTTQYIFREWLPSSKYDLDNKEHFEIMGDKYLGHNNPDSEEEVWIPIKPKNN